MASSPMSTIDAHTAIAGAWDVVVIGAGPAGAVAALGCARLGLRTLVVERSDFPRPKLCGGCLSALGLDTLDRLGLREALERPPAPLVRTIRFRVRGRTATAAAPPMRVIARDAFDTALLNAATRAGAHALIPCSARVDSDGVVALRAGSGDLELRPGAVIDAAGLRGARPARDDDSAPRAGAHVGFGATFASDAIDLPMGELVMAAARGGYVGLVRLPDGRLNAAAAASASMARAHGGPAGAARAIAADAGLDPDLLPERGWTGAPSLTRARPAQEGPVLRVGDAGAFVEPITGEGMSWALATGAAVAEHAARLAADPSAPPTWPAAHRAVLGARLGRCSLVARALRRPSAPHLALRALGAAPGVRDRLVARLAGAPRPRRRVA
jgi:2-polyprenyl-6-methoxyphenol hydroxylase-like FAD-dependent oxidoreductase